MNTEQDYIDALRLGAPSSQEEKAADASTLQLADTAVAAWPQSAELWCLRGDLIQLGNADACWPVAEALRSYEQATRANDTYAYAWESIGHYHDVLTNDLTPAEAAFRRACDLHGGAAARGTPGPSLCGARYCHRNGLEPAR